MLRSRLAACLKASAAVAPIVLLAAPALAQADMSGIEVVTVTARKTVESIQSIPESIQAFSDEELADAHFDQIDDLANMVSNLNITTRFDHTPDVVLRGIGSFGVTQGVGFYVNDVQLFDGQTVRPEDLQRVEVLKGPQGTLYGGNNIGGAIKYITKSPTDNFEAEANAEFGNYDTQTYSGVISGPLSDSLKGRVSLFHSETGGYIYDKVLGRSVSNGVEQGGRATFEYDAGPTTATLYLYGDDYHTGAANLYYRPTSPTDYTLNVTDGTKPDYRRGLYSATLDIDHDLGGGLALTSITSYFHSNEKVITDTDKGPLPILTGHQRFMRNVWSEELRLANSGGGPLTWIAGVFFQGNDPNLYTDATSFTGNPPSPPNLANPANYADQITYARQRLREYAAFGDARYRADNWTFELGLRADYHESKMTDPLYALSGSEDGTELAPKFSASYNFTKDTMGYATVSRGFEPGGMQEGFDVNDNPILSRYKTETVWNYETGLKSTLAEGVLLNVAAFYDTYDNRLFQTYKYESSQFVQVTQNIGSSHNYGVELDLAAYLSDNFFVDANFGITKAIWDSTLVYDPDLAVMTNLKGKTAPYTPEYQGSLSADWTQPITDDLSFGAHASAAFFGQHYWDFTDHYKQKAYQLVNAGVRLDWNNWRLSANMSNIFDQRYMTAFKSAAEIQGPFNVGGIGAPRLWSVALSYKY